MKSITLITAIIFAALSLDASSAIKKTCACSKKAIQIISLAQLKLIAPYLPDFCKEPITTDRDYTETAIATTWMHAQGFIERNDQQKLCSTDPDVMSRTDSKRCLALRYIIRLNRNLYFVDPPLQLEIPEELEFPETPRSARTILVEGLKLIGDLLERRKDYEIISQENKECHERLEKILDSQECKKLAPCHRPIVKNP